MPKRRDAEGFTLIELLISITISSIIIAAVTAAVLVVMNNYSPTVNRFNGSNDAQLLTEWLEPDVTSTGSGIANINQTPGQSYNPCGLVGVSAASSNVVTLSWTDADVPTTTYYAAYWLDAAKGLLTRYSCSVSASGTSTPSAVVVGYAVQSAKVTVSGLEVALQITDGTSGSMYTFSLSASRRTGAGLSIQAPATAAPSTTTPISPGSIVASLGGAGMIPGGPAPDDVITFFAIESSGVPPSCPTVASPSPWTVVGTADVKGNAAYSPSSTSFKFSSDGTYWWYASFSGDSNNLPVHTACPPVAKTTVANLTTISVSVPPSDGSTLGTPNVISKTNISATVSGNTAAAGGTVSFTVFGPLPTSPTTCTSGGTTPPGFSSLPFSPGPPVHPVHPTADYQPSSAGNYWWYATYSGDSQNTGSASTCAPAAETSISSPTFSISTAIVTNQTDLSSIQLTGFSPSETVNIYTDTAYTASPVGSTLTTVATDSSGAVNLSVLTIPIDLTGGTHTLDAVGRSSGDVLGSNEFTVNSLVTFNSASFSSPSGGCFTLTTGVGTGFGAGNGASSGAGADLVMFYLGNNTGTAKASPTALISTPGTVGTTSMGSFSVSSVCVPSTTPDGTYTIGAVDSSTPTYSAFSGTFSIVVPSTCTLKATADTYINGEKKFNDTVYGPALSTNSLGPINSLIQFGVLTGKCNGGNATLPSGAVVESAVLNITATSNARATLYVEPVTCHPWTEALTWKTALVYGCMTSPPSHSATAVVAISPAPTTWNVTTDVQGILTGNNDYGWVVWDPGNGNSLTSLNDRTSSSNYPTLVITYHTSS